MPSLTQILHTSPNRPSHTRQLKRTRLRNHTRNPPPGLDTSRSSRGNGREQLAPTVYPYQPKMDGCPYQAAFPTPPVVHPQVLSSRHIEEHIRVSRQCPHPGQAWLMTFLIWSL